MSTQSLSIALEERKKQLTAMVPAAIMEKLGSNVPNLAARFAPSAPAVGTVAPSFSLKNQLDRSVSLSALLSANHYVVLVWYRGSWCPYCNVTLKAWRDHIPELEKLGARLVAVSAETPDESLDFRRKNELNFDVLTDDACKASGEYGIAYEIGEDMLESHGLLGVKFHEINGNAREPRKPRLVVPAVVVVGKDGKVVFSESLLDYTKRTEPGKVLELLN